jgi:hypothetical protein
VVRRPAQLGEVSWAHYRQAHDSELLALTAEIEHLADYLAGLAALDGALVLTQQLDVVGFGVKGQATQSAAEAGLLGPRPGGAAAPAPALNHGSTRHRTAYRLCLATPECLTIVVSLDGSVQFVHEQAGQIIVWDQLTY